MSTLAEDLERNVHEIIRNLMNNLASLGYEAGFELQTHPPTTTTEAAIKGEYFVLYVSAYMGRQLMLLTYHIAQITHRNLPNNFFYRKYYSLTYIYLVWLSSEMNIQCSIKQPYGCVVRLGEYEYGGMLTSRTKFSNL